MYVEFQNRDASISISSWQGVNEGNVIVLPINWYTKISTDFCN